MFVNKGEYGWYTTAKNYKDDNDKVYVNVRFVNCAEPSFSATGVRIKPDDFKLECYKGKVSMTIFAYQEVKKDESGKFGGEKSQSSQSINIEPADLPFY